MPDDFLATAVVRAGRDERRRRATGRRTTTTRCRAEAIGAFSLQKLGRGAIPVDPAQDFVLGPLSTPATRRPRRPLAQLERARRRPAGRVGGRVRRRAGQGRRRPGQGHTGRVRARAGLTRSLLTLAQSGGLDGALVEPVRFYQTDYTRPLLFLGDGGYLDDQAGARHLHGDQWGMMNETGNYPGQAWLWLYTFWYQIPPFTTAGPTTPTGRLGTDDGALPGARAGAVHPRGAVDPAMGAAAPADLAGLLPAGQEPAVGVSR